MTKVFVTPEQHQAATTRGNEMIYGICHKHNELISIGCKCLKCKQDEELFGEPLTSEKMRLLL